MKIELINFQDSVQCRAILFSSKESFLPISHSFYGGKIYGFVSDFGCGSWGAVTSLGGRTDNPDGKVFIDSKCVDSKELSKYSCFVSESLYNGINSTDDYLTPRKCIEKALELSGLPYTTEDIKEMFNLSGDDIYCHAENGRFNRDLRYVSGEIWRISIAVGFSMGKEIFCFPWLNEREISRADESYLRVLKNNGKIVLIPSSQGKKLRSVCDELIIFEKGKIKIKNRTSLLF